MGRNRLTNLLIKASREPGGPTTPRTHPHGRRRDPEPVDRRRLDFAELAEDLAAEARIAAPGPRDRRCRRAHCRPLRRDRPRTDHRAPARTGHRPGRRDPGPDRGPQPVQHPRRRTLRSPDWSPPSISPALSRPPRGPTKSRGPRPAPGPGTTPPTRPAGRPHPGRPLPGARSSRGKHHNAALCDCRRPRHPPGRLLAQRRALRTPRHRRAARSPRTKAEPSAPSTTRSTPATRQEHHRQSLPAPQDRHQQDGPAQKGVDQKRSSNRPVQPPKATRAHRSPAA